MLIYWKLQFKAAKYYRLAEENGNRIVGNSWYDDLKSAATGLSLMECGRIWKDKYNPQ